MFTPPQSKRFWSKVKKTESCWLWTAGRDGSGNGAFMLEPGRQITARRFAYEEANGPIPKGMRIDSTCNVVLCVRPDHLAIVPRGRVQEKTRDGHFWSKIDKHSSDDCWPWLGATKSDAKFPYPIFAWWDRAAQKNVTVRAARLLWELTFGVRLTDEQEIRHVVCRNPICMNPAHMKIGSSKDNYDDAMRDGTVKRDGRGKRIAAWRPPVTAQKNDV